MADALNTTFSENPVSLDISRSTFTAHPGHTTTMTEGDLVPIFFSEVYPGDTFSVDTAFLARMATPIFPVMANAFIDFFYFYVPNRIVWNHWREFMGENTSAPWTQQTQYTVPQLKFDRDWVIGVSSVSGLPPYAKGYGALPESVINYLGITTATSPVGYTDSETVVHYPNLTVSDLPNRAYRLIWNEFFRDQNLQDPVPVYLDDSDRHYYDCRATFTGQSDVGEAYDYGGKCLKVNKFHDYFTSCLPSPQKGPSVGFTLINSYGSNYASVHTSDESLIGANRIHKDYFFPPLKFDFLSSGDDYWYKAKSDPGGYGTDYYDSLASGSDGLIGSRHNTGITGYNVLLQPDNLVADISSLFASVNTLRQAFATQRLYEAFARGGTRYRELLKSIFGVTSPDARVQVPEYLGGTRIPINMDQVLQTSSTDNTSPQGNTAGYSLTTNVDNSFTKSFVEHGMVIGLAAIRVEHSYSQSIMPFWFRKNMLDFYFPQFANVSEQGVPYGAICASGFNEFDKDQVFGYQEAWADLRFIPSRVSGRYSPLSYFDSDEQAVVYKASDLAKAWTYSDFYPILFPGSTYEENSRPVLGPSWIKENSINIGQTLALPGESQFLVDLKFNITMTRPIPVRSIPGLIDHH